MFWFESFEIWCGIGLWIDFIWKYFFYFMKKSSKSF